MREKVIKDSLTGVGSRIAMEVAVENAFKEAQRFGESAGVPVLAYIDLDRFKSINDTFGHSVGDMALKKFANSLKRTVRNCDFVARNGGDEFQILFKDIRSMSQMKEVMERVQKGVRSLSLTVEEEVIAFTASIGVVFFSKEDLNVEQWIKRADDAMYLSKEAGRDCVYMISDDEVVRL